MKKIKKYCDEQGSTYCTIATVYDLECQDDVYIMLAPEYSLNESDTVYNEYEQLYSVLHTDVICADEDYVKLISDLVKNREILYAKGKIIKKEI